MWGGDGSFNNYSNNNNNNSKIPGNINIHELQFYSPPSQAGPLHQVGTLFASQSPWFGRGC